MNGQRTTNNTIELPVKEAWLYLADNGFRRLHIADIWLTGSLSGIIGPTIRMFQGMLGDDAPHNHTAGYVGSGNVLEALKWVTERSGECYFRSTTRLKVIRNVKWFEDERADVLFHAKRYRGMPYAYGKVLILQALDCLYQTDMFTRCFTLTPLPYCSQMWAQACVDAGLLYLINGKTPDSVQPDDWDDEALKRPDVWQTVLEHDGKICRIYDLTIPNKEAA